MSFGILKKKIYCGASILGVLSAGLGCTKSVPSQFSQNPATDTAPASITVSEDKVETVTRPVDILWVIDNSASMSTSQATLSKGLAKFAADFLSKRGTDVQLAVITTDVFVANDAWQTYLNTPIPSKKQTPLEIHKAKAPGEAQWGPDYAKLSASALMSTKSKAGLVSNFQKRVLVGTQGVYEEHGFDSVDQFIADNEKGSSPNKLFRKGSQRVIIFLSDEDDQSVGANVGPEPRKLLYSGSYYTGANAADADKILPPQFTISCPGTPNVVGQPITADTAMTICVRNPEQTLEPVPAFKARLDAFFRALDGNPNGNPNYFVTAIVGQDRANLEKLRRDTKEKNSETKLTVITNELGKRYMDLVNQTGNGSFTMDIGAKDYSPILAKLVTEITNRWTDTRSVPQTTFDLDRAPKEGARLIVTVEYASGTSVVLTADQFHVAGSKLIITDKSVKADLRPGDRITVQYQPSSVLPAAK